MKRDRTWWVEEVGLHAFLLGGVWGGMGLLSWLTDAPIGLVVGIWLLANAIFGGWMLLSFRVERRRARRQVLAQAMVDLAKLADDLPSGSSVSFHDHASGYVWSYMAGPGWVRGPKQKCSEADS